MTFSIQLNNQKHLILVLSLIVWGRVLNGTKENCKIDAQWANSWKHFEHKIGNISYLSVLRYVLNSLNMSLRRFYRVLVKK